MNALTKTLLGTAAISVLAMSAALAQPKHPAMRVTALHQGKAVNKTKIHNQGATHVTYTFGVYSYVAFADYYKKWAPLKGSFYKWNNSGDLCSNPPSKLKVTKKTLYGKARADTMTYSLGCSSGPTLFHGLDYKITDANAQGHIDLINAALKGNFHNGSSKYKGTLNLDVNVTIQ